MRTARLWTGEAAGMSLKIYRAKQAQIDLAYGLVQEYYAAASVVLREDRQEFARQYFADGAGFWLAEAGEAVVGCAALRRLNDKPDCGEIKRLYVQPPHRGQGIADLLLEALESYAKKSGYQWLYLDTAAEMKAATRFYQRKGFLPCQRYNENPQAAIFMRKALV